MAEEGGRDVEALNERIYQFALRVLKVGDALPPRRVSSRVVGWQLVKTGTSTASNYEEARGAMSRKEFVAKLAISYRESREAVFWLRVVRDAELLAGSRMESIIQEGLEIRAILGSSLKTARSDRATDGT